MRRVLIDNLKGNERVARPVYSLNGSFLLSKGIHIKKSYIVRLRELGVDYIYIEDELSEGVELKDFIEEKTRENCKKEVKKVLENYSTQGHLELTNIVSAAQNIVEDVLTQRNIIVNLVDIRRKDEYTYAHSVNVCALAVLLSIKLGYNKNRVKDIAIGALLHDLGKVIIPEEILNKPGKLTEKEYGIVKQHVIYGYEAISEASWISSISKVIILTHHENVDGSGYPFGWSGNKINSATKIISICNVFDSMVTKKPYREAYKIYEVIEFLIANKGRLFDEELVDEFIKYIAVYPSGMGIITNEGAKGIVLKQNNGFPSRPIIRILEDENGKCDKWVEIDLMENKKLFIVDTYEI
ncbi:HD-GYP domain-containing protein [Vallitalea sp.]|jgi:HD-GYP domain-containing protein (c-di-GMP phosphodiesterase class II)|uniref:HD-GYP domain-containing protein n=1 Tax=Vallitalea sp. TaxID=1882829 RepID=UPI0025E2A5D9|nr:HD-GYP domain-containing protein [Vallitalea sp.]MCT4687671.1 HD-GYP domain-containing protein [Vallitalea sp.]